MTMYQERENLFVGVNPHLISLLQTLEPDGTDALFRSFHSDHVTHIKDFLNRYLPDEYLAITTPSLQRRDEDLSQAPKMMPSVAIYAPHEAGYAVESAPVLRIELLTPTNMRGGKHGDTYQLNRTNYLLAGTPLVEIDYLHEYPSPVRGLPRYPDDPQAQAFNITVTNPQAQDVTVCFFGIQAPIPTIGLPLGSTDHLDFDFSEPFSHTWDASRFNYLIDYDQPPVRMNRYRADDQAKIQARLAEIQTIPGIE